MASKSLLRAGLLVLPASLLGFTAVRGAPPDVDASVANEIRFAIDSARDVHPISRFIYGMNAWDPSARPANLALSRAGGNRMTAWNWETNDSNAGADFHNQNDSYLGGGVTPNGAIKRGLEAARAAGAAMLVTMPIIGYVAADHNSDGDVALSGPDYLQTRFNRSLPRKGRAFSLTPDITDAFVYQDEYVNFLDKNYPDAFASGNNPIFIELDNSPDRWQFTHARLRGDGNVESQSGTAASYAELVQRTTDYAAAAKDVNPSVLTFGPVCDAWWGTSRLPDPADGGSRDFLAFYLAQMAAADARGGRRLLDVLDVHWSPAALGVGAAPGAKIRITGQSTDRGVSAARKQAPRSLWDPAYTEDSWVAQSVTDGPIRLIPLLREKIAANYPGTALALTEYNFGGGGHISGAVAQADALGIFGREGLFAATLWHGPADDSFIYGAFDMYRNFDGANGSFGDTSVRATTSDLAQATVYASVDAGNPNRMVLVCINKSDAARIAAISIRHGVQFHSARVYLLSGRNSVPKRQADRRLSPDNALQYRMPANSVTTLVLLP